MENNMVTVLEKHTNNERQAIAMTKKEFYNQIDESPETIEYWMKNSNQADGPGFAVIYDDEDGEIGTISFYDQKTFDEHFDIVTVE